MNFERTLAIDEMNGNWELVQFYIRCNGANRELATLAWDGLHQQLYLHYSYGTPLTPVHVSFDGEINTPTIHESFLLPEIGKTDIILLDKPYYFSKDGVVNPEHAIQHNNCFLRLNNCSLFFEAFQYGVVFDLNCQFNGDFPKSGGVTILCNYHQINNTR